MNRNIKTVASFALGCKVNQYESEAIGRLFAENGYELADAESCADAYIINTCTVTNFGDKKSRQLIRRVKKLNPDAIVAVTGCYAQTSPAEIAAIDGVNIILGTKDRKSILRAIEEYDTARGVVNLVSDIKGRLQFEELPTNGLTAHTRAYLKIQDGCDRYCSYCIIPYARGAVRSRPVESVRAEAVKLAEKGFKEIVLTGIHVASYGKDLGGATLMDAVRAVHGIDGISRIRLSSVEPVIITDDFMRELTGLSKVCPHFHLSLQSGCDKILTAMNRRYTSAQYMEAVKTIRRYMPDSGLTTDIIVGFPGETEEDFTKTLAFAEAVGFSKLHVFPFSPKKGTPAAKMPGQLPNSIKSDRSRRLIALGEKMSREFAASFKSRDLTVLFERELEPGLYEGHTGNYIRALAKSSTNVTNLLLPVSLTGAESDDAAMAVIKI